MSTTLGEYRAEMAADEWSNMFDMFSDEGETPEDAATLADLWLVINGYGDLVR